jgi:MFS family permease
MPGLTDSAGAICPVSVAVAPHERGTGGWALASEATTDYWQEFRTHWRPLLAATMGLGFGIGINSYVMAVFAPVLLDSFGWSRAQFALLGTLALIILVTSPIAGRLTDRFGVRRVAAIGVFTLPFTFIALAMQDGNIMLFFAICAAQSVLGVLTTSAVFCRLAAERFEAARGLAFAVIASGPPLAGALLSPVMAGLIESEGWRTTYLIVGGFTFAMGALALLLTPPQLAVTSAEQAMPRERPDYRAVFASRPFWILIIGMVLVNVPQAAGSTQLKVMLLDSGAPEVLATWLVSVYALGVIIGRFACGYSLDRLAPEKVAALSLSLPAIGLALIASPLDSAAVLIVAVALMGLAQGAEGDIAAYLVGQHFALKNFSLVLGFVGSAITGGIFIGSIILSMMLSRYDSFAPYLLLSAGATLLGGAMFLLLRERVTR